MIRTSQSAQKIDVAGCDPLQVPLSKFLYHQTENFWLHRIAHGREVYVTPMGEVSHAVFVSEILSQLQSRQINLDLVAQHRASTDGQQLDKKDAIRHIVEILAQTIQSWTPRRATDHQSQHQIAELQAKIAELEARQQVPNPTNPADPPNPPEAKSSPANSPLPRHSKANPSVAQLSLLIRPNSWSLLGLLSHGLKPTNQIPLPRPASTDGSSH